MDLGILGPFEARVGDRVLELGRGRQVALLADLALHANTVVSRDRLIDDVWSGRPPPTAVKALQGQVSRLRRILGAGGGSGDGVLETRSGGYLLRLAEGAIDAERFERLVAEGRRAVASGDAAGGRSTLGAALGLWRGPALCEFTFEEFAQGTIARLEDLRLVALEARIDADLSLGLHQDVVSELEALTRQHPLRERLRGQLMLALYGSGRQGDALHVFRVTRRTFVQELGLEPGEPLRALERAILNHDPALTPPLPAAAPAAAPHPERAARAGGRSKGAGRTIEGDALVAFDPASLTPIRAVAVGSRPVAVTVGHGSLWVANADDGTLSRVDPERAEVIRTIGIAAPVVDLAAAPGAVWTANGSDGTLSKVDPASHTVVGTIDLSGSNPLAPDSVSTIGWGAGRLWVGYGTHGLAQVDGVDAPTVTPIAMTNPTVAVTYGAGAVWAATVDGRVHRIEPRTGAITTETPVGHPLDITFGEGAVWLADAQGRAWRLDMQTGAVSYVASVGASPVGIHAGGGGVWVACNGDSAIVRLDPDTCAVAARISLGAPPTDVVLMNGVLWASVQRDRLC